jgi:UDP-GlcNAc:undecaprenyl-phosphate GlcNAc-1-phosphate transferase
MTTVIAIFLLALVLALTITPLVRRIARKHELLDQPSERKVHKHPIPRVGGIAIYLAFFLPFASTFIYSTGMFGLLVLDRQMIALIIGASLVFGVGLWDDVRGLKPTIKLMFQGLSALIAYEGGIRIALIALPGTEAWTLGWLSLPVTLLWFLLVINAINLVDGLDGLAAGVSFFASMVLLVLCATSGKLLLAMGLAALGGATLGFLRYNFNPASIFMGDSGSYFLGYVLAALSVLGSIKSQAAVAILIPIIALGFPLMEAVFAPIRRFMIGERLFKADKEHFHHRLLRFGLTHRRAVLLLYGVTICFGALSLFVVHARDDRAALILLLVGAAFIFAIQKLGYLEYLAMDKIIGWFRDVTDELGLAKDRRTFLGCQVAITQSATLAQLWEQTSAAAQFLGLDYVELKIYERYGELPSRQASLWEFREGELDTSSLDSNRSMYISLPLENKEHHLGSLIVAKDLLGSPLTPFTLRRIEQLRRTVTEALLKLSTHKLAHFPKLQENVSSLFPAVHARQAPGAYEETRPAAAQVVH